MTDRIDARLYRSINGFLQALQRVIVRPVLVGDARLCVGGRRHEVDWRERLFDRAEIDVGVQRCPPEQADNRLWTPYDALEFVLGIRQAGVAGEARLLDDLAPGVDVVLVVRITDSRSQILTRTAGPGVTAQHPSLAAELVVLDQLRHVRETVFGERVGNRHAVDDRKVCSGKAFVVALRWLLLVGFAEQSSVRSAHTTEFREVKLAFFDVLVVGTGEWIAVHQVACIEPELLFREIGNVLRRRLFAVGPALRKRGAEELGERLVGGGALVFFRRQQIAFDAVIGVDEVVAFRVGLLGAGAHKGDQTLLRAAEQQRAEAVVVRAAYFRQHVVTGVEAETMEHGRAVIVVLGEFQQALA